jgi:hypothetical protein
MFISQISVQLIYCIRPCKLHANAPNNAIRVKVESTPTPSLQRHRR